MAGRERYEDHVDATLDYIASQRGLDPTEREIALAHLHAVDTPQQFTMPVGRTLLRFNVEGNTAAEASKDTSKDGNGAHNNDGNEKDA